MSEGPISYSPNWWSGVGAPIAGNPLPMPNMPMGGDMSWGGGPSYMASPAASSTGGSWMNAYGANANAQMPSGYSPSGAGAAPAGGGGFWGNGGFNLGSVGTIAQGIGALGSAYLGFKNYKLAKEGLDLSKLAFNTNMNNSIKTYNTSLEDRIRGRTAAYNGKEGDVQSYLSRHSLSR